jgi:hypothetical protein
MEEKMKMGIVNRMVQEAIAECDKVRLPVIVLTDSMKMGTMQLIGNAKTALRLEALQSVVEDLTDQVAALTEAVGLLAMKLDGLAKPTKEAGKE